MPRLPLRTALAAALLALAALAPAAGAAGSVRRVALPLDRATASGGWRVLPATRIPGGFSLVGLHWRGARTARVEVRAITSSGRRGRWQELAPADRPGARERRSGATVVSEPAWTGRAVRLQVRVRGSVRALTAVAVRPGPDPVLRPPATRLRAAAPPQDATVLSRATWGADEKLRKGEPAYAPRVRAAVIHHTTTPNGYTAAQVPAIIRAIYLYHVRGNGWADLGYNFLVDRDGRIYEGRFGGVTRNVVGAHTEGFNAGTVGVALIGTFTSAAPTAAQRRALVRLLAWRLDLAHADPAGRVELVSAGSRRHPKGRRVELPVILAHRDAYPTECPGDAMYRLMGDVRAAVAATGNARILDPSVEPARIAEPFRPIRFRARLAPAGPWRVVVRTTGGATVASYAGSGATVDATWDGRVAGGGPLPRAALLRWRIEAGAARPAEGDFTGSVTAPSGGGGGASSAADTLRAAPEVLTGEGGGRVTWRQLAPGLVKVVLARADGTEVLVLKPAGAVAAGPQEVAWNGRRTDGAPVPSGHYQYILRIQRDGAKGVENVAVPVDVRRQVTGYTATAALSPNGDGVADVAAIAFTRNEPGDAQLRLFRGRKLVENVALLYDQAPGPFAYRWTAAGVADGRYELQLLVPGAGGAVELRAPVVVDTRPPALRVRAVRRLPRRGDWIVTVRLSEPGTVAVRRGARVVATRTATRAGTVRIRLPKAAVGRAPALRVEAVDTLGNETRRVTSFRVPRS